MSRSGESKFQKTHLPARQHRQTTQEHAQYSTTCNSAWRAPFDWCEESKSWFNVNSSVFNCRQNFSSECVFLEYFYENDGVCLCLLSEMISVSWTRRVYLYSSILTLNAIVFSVKRENLLQVVSIRLVSTWTGYWRVRRCDGTVLLGFQRAWWLAAFRRVGAAYPPRVVSTRQFQRPRNAPY